MIESCALCHGSGGMGIEARSAPRLAGLDAAYLERQLNAFASGERGSAAGDQFGPQMAVIAQSLDPAARKQAASYYSQLPSAAQVRAPSPSAPPAFATCAGCHGADGEGNQAVGAPRIAGQAGWYVDRSLRLYRSGGRGAAPDDAMGQQMAAATKGLGDAEIAGLSGYVESLGGKAK